MDVIDVSQFSRTKKEFKLITKNEQPHLVKEFGLRTLAGKHHPHIFYRQILEYLAAVEKAAVEMPAMVEHYVSGDTLSFTCRYHGKNFLQIAKNPKELVGKLLPHTKKVISILRKFQRAGVCMDPHIKNFVIDEDEVYYVDFSPPYSPEYNKVVLNATPSEHKEIVQKNLDCFNPDMLGFHFAGDLLKESDEYLVIMPEIYNLLIDEKVIDVSYEEFLRKANEVKQIELDRVATGLHMS